MTFAREPLQVVEIIQPLCSRTFGVSPCLATGEKCWNTDVTCKFLAALDLSEEIAIRFVAPAANRFLASGFQPGTAIPSLISVDTAPTVLNVGAGDDNISPLGLRAVATVAIKDHPYNDAEFDPYLADRTYDPSTRGSFWSKWLVRNPFHTGYTLRIYDGYFGDELADMIKREYSIEKIDAGRSSVQITAKDILRLVTDNDATAPTLSPGALSAAIDASVTSFTVAGAVAADYPATGRVRIGSEIVSYTSRVEAAGIITFSGGARAQLETTAATHAQNDQVQRVLSYEAVALADIIYDLLVIWGGIPASYIDQAAWQAEGSEWREIYNFTTHLASPVSIQTLVGELCQQGLSNVWWDERVQEILFRAQRPNFSADTLTQSENIVADSFSVVEKPEARASQVAVYYGLRSPVLSVSDPFSYANAEIFIDVNKEQQYGEPKLKQIFCRWVNTAVIAASLANTYLQRFKDVRKHLTFSLTAKDIGNVWTGDIVNLTHFMLVDFTGLEKTTPWLITSAETVTQGGVYRFVAEDNESAGILWAWVADSDTAPIAETGVWCDDDGNDNFGDAVNVRWL
jgi:hypothetical protein